jgi:xanthine dehydrogenase accessory factor
MIFWQHISEKLQENNKVYLLIVIENFGSSPGRQGFKMLVSEDGFIYGSIGGGVMEFSLVEEMKELLKHDKPKNFIKKQIHKGKIKNGSGMICSGEQTVAFHLLDSKNSSLIETIIETLKKEKIGVLSLSPRAIQFSQKRLHDKFEYSIQTNEDWSYKEQIGFKETLYIVGGGHVGLATSKLFNSLGFYVVVFDDRSNLNTFEENTYAHKKILISYDSIENYIEESNVSYIAIMTNKYTEDKLVLSKIIRNEYKFVGVLGSKAKLKTMREVMLKEGFSNDELDNVYAPIGLSIHSQTPEEIAVSIAAQIIQIKNKTE